MLGGNGLIGMLPPKFILGYTSDETVLLDFDKSRLEVVIGWSRRACERFRLGGFLILESSGGCFHVVFDRKVSWSESMAAVAWVAGYSGSFEMQKWHRMQCIKGSSTLRGSPKGAKSFPVVVFSEGDQGGEIAEYLVYSDFIKSFYEPLEPCGNV